MTWRDSDNSRWTGAGCPQSSRACPIRTDAGETANMSTYPDSLPPPAADVDRWPGLRALSVRQAGVVSREQLRQVGLTWGDLEAQLATRRWSEYGPLTVLLRNCEPTRLQLRHAAALHVGDKGCLAAATALEVHGLQGFCDDDQLHVLTPRASTVAPLPGLVVHESRRLRPEHIVMRAGLPMTGLERSVIDRGAWQRRPRFVYALLAASVQQWLTTANRLLAELRTVGQVRHVAHMRLAVHDIVGGSQALSEIDLVRFCRKHRLQPPEQQAIRRDARGKKRYLDAEWRLLDGSVLVLEVDGAHHIAVAYWTEDMKRGRQLFKPGRYVLRCGAHELRLQPAELAADLELAGVPRLIPRLVTARPSYDLASQ